MDPNAALARIRAIYKKALDEDYPFMVEDIELMELASAVLDLDEWLSKGGFLPDAWASCDACGGSGYLLGQSYGYTIVPRGGVFVQRCDQCGRFDSDLEAAMSAAHDQCDEQLGSLVIAIGGRERAELAPQSDVFIMKTETLIDTHVQWVTTKAAKALGWYLPPRH